MTTPPSHQVLAALWRLACQPPAALDAMELTGAEPVLPSSFAVGTAAQTTVAASALAAAELWRMRTGRQQQVSVAMRDAAIETRSEHYLGIDGKPLGEIRDKIAGLYRCGDGRWVRLHTNLPHHCAGTLKLLGCDHDRASVQRALDRWEAYELEDAAVAAGLVVTATRSFAEWDVHPQGRAVAELPPFTIEKIGDAQPEPLPAGDRPLSGIKVLDLTRVIAGPVCGRTLASHGADVLLITAAHLPSMESLVIDNGRGKLAAQLDLRDPSAREKLAALLRQADIFVQGYRPGAIAQYGFSAEQAAKLRPGIVCVSICAYSHEGPWARRRGFDSLVQNANGLNDAEAQAFGASQPKPLPAQALDHGTGFLMAFAAMSALKRRATEGGSWHVRCSLAQTGVWFRGLGRVDGTACPDLHLWDVQDRLYDSHSGFGRLTAVRHSAVMSETPPRWERPSVPLGTDPAAWPS
ncbi:MAG: CoA transferase [Xanthobacteraceae bacterium]|jgi:crotonobetainyl-CoA:carnitine CoA-transferase CaiB-like acyl-CoA transferase